MRFFEYLMAMASLNLYELSCIYRSSRFFRMSVNLFSAFSLVTSLVQLVAAATVLSLGPFGDSYPSLQHFTQPEHDLTVTVRPFGPTAVGDLNSSSGTDVAVTNDRASYFVLTTLGVFDFALMALVLLTSVNTSSCEDPFYRLLPLILFLYVYIVDETVLWTCCWIPLVVPDVNVNNSLFLVANLFSNRTVSLIYWPSKILTQVIGSAGLLLRMCQLASVVPGRLSRRDDDDDNERTQSLRHRQYAAHMGHFGNE